MFGSLGFPEILFILALALIVFGPRRLPEVGRTIGRALGEFRRATGDLKRSFDQEINSFEDGTGPDSPVAGTRPQARAPVPEPVSETHSIADPESGHESEDEGKDPTEDGEE